jgi:hypothetical protein
MYVTDFEHGSLLVPMDADERPSAPAERKRAANEYMRAGLEHHEPSEPIPFFRECGSEQCFRPAWLTRTEYDRRRPEPGWRTVAPEHDEADRTLARARAVGS